MGLFYIQTSPVEHKQPLHEFKPSQEIRRLQRRPKGDAFSSLCACLFAAHIANKRPKVQPCFHRTITHFPICVWEISGFHLVTVPHRRDIWRSRDILSHGLNIDYVSKIPAAPSMLPSAFCQAFHWFWMDVQFLKMLLLCHVFSPWWWLSLEMTLYSDWQFHDSPWCSGSCLQKQLVLSDRIRKMFREKPTRTAKL